MGIIVTPPEEICFSKNRIVWQFEDDKDGVVPGVPAENWLTIGGSVVAGTQAVFRWGDNELRFTASDSPDSSLAQFPTWEYDEAGMQAYIESLVPYFQNNYFIDEYFEVSADSKILFGVTIWLVKFVAKQSGSWFNFSRTTFNNGGVANGIVGTDDSTIVNNSVFIEVWIGDENSVNFTRIHKAVLQFDENSQVFVDVSEILHSQLSSELPELIGSVAMKCQNSRRQYHLRYAQAGGQSLMIGKVSQTGPMVVLLGGFGEWSSSDLSVTARLRESVLGLDKLLILRSRTRIIRQDEPVFVSWVNFATVPRTVHASAKILFADGTTQTTNTNVISGVGQYEKLIFGIGFSQLNLTVFNGIRDVREYTVQLRDDLGPVSEEYRLVVDYSYREFVRYFAFVNSWGAIDTLVTYGKASNEWKVSREQAEKFMPHVYTQTEGQFVEWKHEYQDNAEVASGWISKKSLSVFLDMFISPIKFRVIKGLPYPIAINSDSISRGSDGDNLHAVTFEYQFQRRFESLSEEELEGEDTADFIPANVVLAGSLATLPGSSTGSTGSSGGGSVRVDPYPIPGSNNPISSNAIFVLLQQKQDKLPVGTSLQYFRGDGKLMNLKAAVNANETDPTVPAFAKSLTSMEYLVNALGALPAETGLDVPKLGGQLASWYIQRATHPAFDRVPPIVVERGVPFEKYLDLSLYKTSFHPNEDLTVEIVFNTDKLSGVAVTASGLQITLKGTLEEIISERDNVLLIVRDPARNQTTVALRIQNIDEPEEPEPDNRPVCQKGPYHWPQSAIQVFDNGRFRAPFDANGVNPLLWVLAVTQSASNPLRQGEAPPYNNTPWIDVTMDAPVAGGTYWLGISGKLCKSPWDWRQITFPDTTTLNWSEGYPKFNSNESYDEFLAKVDTSGRYLTQLLNISTNTTEYSQEHDYVADTTEIQVWKPGGYADGKYRFMVGGLSQEFIIGTPPVPPEIFKLVNGWDGSTLADLTAGPYQGPVPPNGFNGYFEDQDTGVAYRLRRLVLEKKVSGSWVQVTSVGGAAVTPSPSTVVPASRLITAAGVDSRSIAFQGVTLNRGGEYRFSVYLHSGTTQDTSVIKTYQQTFRFSGIEITGNWVNVETNPALRTMPGVSGVQVDGANVLDSTGYIEPWHSSDLGDRNFEFSFDKVTWYGTGTFWSGGVPVRITLTNNGPIDLFPKGSNKLIYLRDGLNPTVISAAFRINQSAVIGGELSAKSYARGYWEHVNFEKVMTPDGPVFNDLATALPASGKEFWYVFNREIIKSAVPLTGYQYPRGKPYGVYKIQVQIGYSGTLWPWHGQDGSNESIAEPFPHNSSVAFDCGIQNKK